jgi:hypothetical protein
LITWIDQPVIQTRNQSKFSATVLPVTVKQFHVKALL